MDHKAGFFSDLAGGQNTSVLCFRASMSTSAGIWLQDYPLEFSFPLLLLQLSIIFLACHIIYFLLRRIGLPKVISHSIAGIILGPSCLSRNRAFQETIFLTGQFAFVLFIFVIGVQTDLNIIRRSGRKALAVAVFGTILKFVAIIASSVAYSGIVEDLTFGTTVSNIALRWAVTSNTGVACLLVEFNLLTSKLGRLAISASLISDILVVTIIAVFNSIYYSNSIIGTFVSLFSFIGLIIFICGGETLMAAPLLFGLLLPSGPRLGSALVDRS